MGFPDAGGRWERMRVWWDLKSEVHGRRQHINTITYLFSSPEACVETRGKSRAGTRRVDEPSKAQASRPSPSQNSLRTNGARRDHPAW